MKVLFRAEAEDLDELSLNAHDLLTEINGKFYAIGCWSPEAKVEVTDKRGFIYRYQVKQETKAIHFEDMLDSEDNPIFASLSLDGKGGDYFKKPFSGEGMRYENGEFSTKLEKYTTEDMKTYLSIEGIQQ